MPSIAIALVTFLGIALSCELALRLFPPAGLDVGPPPERPESPFQYDERFGFETKPYAEVFNPDEDGGQHSEKLDKEGFRGEDVPEAKPGGEVRIAAIGDSVVQGFSVARDYHWGVLLEKALRASRDARFINAGIGGYVSSQLVSRLERRVLKYQPDVALVQVGWNDLVFSSLPTWRPRMDLTHFEQAYVNRADGRRDPFLKRAARVVARVSRLLAWWRAARNKKTTLRQRRKLLADRQVASGRPFNEAALRIFDENLEALFHLLQARGVRMALIVPPTILNAEILDDTAVHEKLFVYYACFPLSTREYLEWLTRYNDTRRRFAARHPEVILIDAHAEFDREDRDGRLSLFTDLAHLTRAGNLKLAGIVAQALERALRDRAAA